MQAPIGFSGTFSNIFNTPNKMLVFSWDIKLEKTAFNYKSRVFIVLWTLTFLLTFTVSMVSTPTPYLTKEFVTGEDVESATMEAYGVILSLGYVAITLGSLLGGFIADIIGRRTVVFASFIVLAVGCGLFVVAPNLYWLFLASFIEMFAVGFSGPAISALVADYSGQSSRGMAFGVFNLSWVTAQIPAPLLGGVIAQVSNLRTPFIIAVFISIFGVLFSILMKGKHAEKKQVAEEEGAVIEELDLKQVVSLKRVILIFSLTNLLNGLLNGFIAPLTRGFLMFRLNADPTEFGLVSSIAFGVVTGLVQIPGGKLADKFGRKPLVLFGFLGAPVVLILALSQSLLEFTFLMGAICAVGNISAPAISAWLMDLVPQRRRASVSGITRTLNGVGLSVGPTFGSFAWNSTKPDATIPFGVAAVIYAVSLPFYLMLAEPTKGSPKTREAP